DGGTVFRQRVQAHLNPVFAFIVQRAGCLVQNQYGRIFQENAGDGNALFLAAGEAGAAVAHVGVVSVGERFDKIVDVGFFCRADDLLHGSFRFSVGDVLPDGAAEQVDLLLYDADLAAQGFQRQAADILSVDGDFSSRDVIETGQKRADGGF